MIRSIFVGAAIFIAAFVGASVVANAQPPYANCTQAHKDGRFDIPKGDPAYAPHLDRDGDGIACESR